MTSAFSKVGDLIEDDDEEERLDISRRGQALYKKAQDAYNSKGSNEDVLRLFVDAEEAMKPLLGSGLANLEPQELETVLKGRLHQAVVTAHLESLPDRWPKVKALAEDVLQFDFNNAHARWLRGLSLLHGFQRSKEAEEECRRAAECARLQGKDDEASQWEQEIQRSFIEAAKTAVPDGVPVESQGEAGAAEEAVKSAQTEEGEKVAQPSASKKAAHTSPALQKGFFNRASRKEEDAAKAQVRTETQASVAQEAKLNQELKELRERLSVKEAELQKQEARAKEELAEAESRLREGVEVISEEFENYLSELPFGSGASPASSSSGRLQASAEQAQERSQAGRAWAEKEQQRYSELSTEVLTLKDMTSREARERQEATSKQCADMRELAKRFAELTKSAKRLDEYVRFRSTGEEEAADDMERLAVRVADFHGLPQKVKLAAMLDDGAVLRVMMLAAVMGMLFMLGLFVEVFSAKSCRLVCST